jgi:hypothetical protein
MLRNGKCDVIEDLKEQFNESMYFNAQKKLLQNGTKSKANELFEVGQGSHDLFESIFFKDETLIITKSDIIKFQG